jgi:outer membrane protein assembly factor BamB
VEAVTKKSPDPFFKQEHWMSNHFRGLVALLVVISMTFLDHAHGGDWPNIMGPNRNGIASDEQIADQWPAAGPRKIWEAKIGSGFAGVAVSGRIAVLFHRERSDDKLTAFDSETGERLWTASFSSSFVPQIVDDDGPRAVPTVQDGAIFAYSSEGNLHCVDLKTGEKRWTRKTHQDFGANGGYFGAGSAPLVEGKYVIVNVGGDKKKAGIVAFHVDSGETAWSAVSDQAGYSAPVAVTLDNTRHLLCITRLNFVSLDPLTGKERFRVPFGQRGPTVNAAIPIVFNNRVLLTASYGIGAQLLEIGPKNCEVIWSDEILSSQYTTPILHEGLIYGIDGRQDGGPVALKCFDPMTRKEQWSKSGFKYATLIGANGLLLIVQTDGVLKMARLSKDRYEELASSSVLPGTTRALPALANGRLYIRNEKTLVCVDLSAK